MPKKIPYSQEGRQAYAKRQREREKIGKLSVIALVLIVAALFAFVYLQFA